MSSTPTVSSATPPTGPTFSPPPSPSQSQSNDGNNNNGGPSSSLYLFTFLATLFLLLFVSSAIILRSFILRRRFRRRIEEAILAGVIPPPQTGRVNRRRVIGEKPKLWEAHVHPASDVRWDAIVPVSAQSTMSASGQQQHGIMTSAANATGGERQAAAAAAPAPLLPPTHDDPSRPLYRRSWLRDLFSWRRGASSSLPMDLPPISETFEDSRSPGLGLQGQNPPSSTQDRLRVTVLVAMPDPRRPHAGQSKGKKRSIDLDYDEDDLPEMALGLTELQYMDTVTITTPKIS